MDYEFVLGNSVWDFLSKYGYEFYTDRARAGHPFSVASYMRKK